MSDTFPSMLCSARDVLNGAELSEGLELVFMAMRFGGEITHIDEGSVERIVLTL